MSAAYTQASGNKLALEYTVIASNETTNTWYNADFSESYQYDISVGSNFTVILNNSSDFNSELDIAIGNITRSNILDTEAEGALALGYWQLPNMFGFIANNSWNDVITDFKEVDMTSDFKENVDYPILGTANSYQFFFNDSYQTTTLIYDIDGILLYANSTVFGFYLEFKLISVDGNTEYYSLISETPFDLSFLLAIPAILVIRRRK